MGIRSTSTLPQLRTAMLTGVSALALCLGASAGAYGQSVTIEGEGSWLRPFGDEVPYAVYRELDLGFNVTDTSETLDRGDDFTGRGQVIWHFNDWLSISGGAGFAGFDNTAAAPSANLYTALPWSFIYPQIVTVPDLIGPCPQICEQIYSDGAAALETDLEFYDFDVGADVRIGRNGKARFFAGVRYVSFDESLRGSFTNFDAGALYQAQTLDVTRASSFEGWGPRIGFTADVPIGSSGFSFGGTVAVAALYGDITTNIDATHTSTGGGVNTFGETSKSGKTAYSVEVAPQISYTLSGDYLSAKISAGYRFDHYLGIVDTATRQAFGALTPAGDSADDVKFDGPFLRVGVKFGGKNSWAER